MTYLSSYITIIIIHDNLWVSTTKNVDADRRTRCQSVACHERATVHSRVRDELHLAACQHETTTITSTTRGSEVRRPVCLFVSVFVVGVR